MRQHVDAQVPALHNNVRTRHASQRHVHGHPGLHVHSMCDTGDMPCQPDDCGCMWHQHSAAVSALRMCDGLVHCSGQCVQRHLSLQLPAMHQLVFREPVRTLTNMHM